MSKLKDVLEIMDRLTKSEKRYVTLILKEKNSDESHLKLYHLLATFNKGMNNLEEKELQLKRKKEKEGLQKLFSTQNLVKIHHFLLASLRQYNADKPLFSIEEQIQNIRILLQKRCLEQALKLIARTRKEIAERFEEPLKELELILLERRIMRMLQLKSLTKVKKLRQSSNDILEEIKEILAVYSDDEALHQRDLYDHHILESELSETLKKLINDLNYADHMPFKAAVIGLSSLSDYYSYTRKEPDKAIEAAQKLVELYQQNPWRMTYAPENYLTALIKFFNKLYLNNRVPDFGPTLERIKTVLRQNKNDSSVGFTPSQLDFSPRSATYYNLLNLIIIYYMHNLKDPKAPSSITEVGKVMSRKPNIKDNLLLTIYFNLTTYHLLADQLDLAQNYLNEILNYSGRTAPSIKFRAEILKILMDFETSSTKKKKTNSEQKLGAF